MRVLPFPEVDAMEVFDACVASIGTLEIQQRLIGAREALGRGYSYYAEQARSNSLYSIPAIEANNEDLTTLNVTVGELKNLYSQQLAVKAKSSRHYYDKMLASVPRAKCPFCGFGQASTLDHFLPKSKFPWYSVLPMNLVPACKDCNHGKGNAFATVAADQGIHPYFESAIIGQQRWLFAEVHPTSPASVRFFSSPPSDWEAGLRGRINHHFNEYDLARRFAVEAATEIAGISSMLSYLAAKTGESGVKEQLDATSISVSKIETNSWKSALYQALADTEWYWKGGFQI